MKYCITTQFIGDDYEALSKVTIPLMQKYAKYVGADFKITETTHLGIDRITYNNLNCFELLKSYDYVLFLDVDCLIARQTGRNIFEEYSDCMMAIKPYRSDKISDALYGQRHQVKKYANLSHNSTSIFFEDYYNTGVFLLRQDAYDYRYIYNDWGYPLEDEIYLNHLIYYSNIQFRQLDSYFHYVYHIDDEWNRMMDKEKILDRCRYYMSELNKDMYRKGIIHFSFKPKNYLMCQLINHIRKNFQTNNWVHDYEKLLYQLVTEYYSCESVNKIQSYLRKINERETFGSNGLGV